jgi:hypothetical protein
MSGLGWYVPKQKWSDFVDNDELWDKYQALEQTQLEAVTRIVREWVDASSGELTEARREETIYRLGELSFNNRADVYFLKGAPGELIKIGSSHNVKKRLMDVRFRSGLHTITCLAITPGGSGLEHFLHRVFRKSREDGEWFSPTPELLRLVGMFAAAETARQ